MKQEPRIEGSITQRKSTGKHTCNFNIGMQVLVSVYRLTLWLLRYLGWSPEREGALTSVGGSWEPIASLPLILLRFLSCLSLLHSSSLAFAHLAESSLDRVAFFPLSPMFSLFVPTIQLLFLSRFSGNLVPRRIYNAKLKLVLRQASLNE